jgi:hypothetical protein
MSLQEGVVRLDWAAAAAAKAPTERDQSIGGSLKAAPMAAALELRRHPGGMVEASDVRGDEVRVEHHPKASPTA